MLALAELVGTSQQQVDRLEKGKRKLSAEWIDVFCKALNCKPGELVEFSVEAPTSTTTANAEVLGAIETKFGNNIREFDSDEKYEIRFKPARKDLNKKFFALVVEGGSYLSYPDGTELIFAEESRKQVAAGAHEDAADFVASQSKNLHNFKSGSLRLAGTLIKSIRSE